MLAISTEIKKNNRNKKNTIKKFELLIFFFANVYNADIKEIKKILVNNIILLGFIKDVNNKSIKSIAKELTILISKAKNKRLSIEDLSGGCITISSLGGISGKFFTPIINPPEVSILGISKIQIKPMLINNKFTARKMLPLSLSYDHRVVDGADAAEFTKLFSFYISNPNELLDE